MDITAKHAPPDKDGDRIATLDELAYRFYIRLFLHQYKTVDIDMKDIIQFAKMRVKQERFALVAT